MEGDDFLYQGGGEGEITQFFKIYATLSIEAQNIVKATILSSSDQVRFEAKSSLPTLAITHAASYQPGSIIFSATSSGEKNYLWKFDYDVSGASEWVNLSTGISANDDGSATSIPTTGSTIHEYQTTLTTATNQIYVPLDGYGTLGDAWPVLTVAGFPALSYTEIYNGPVLGTHKGFGFFASEAYPVGTVIQAHWEQDTVIAYPMLTTPVPFQTGKLSINKLGSLRIR